MYIFCDAKMRKVGPLTGGTYAAFQAPVKFRRTDPVATTFRPVLLTRILRFFKPLLATAFFAMMLVDAFGQPIQISIPPLTLPSSALNHGIIGNQPADGSVQSHNPPLFKWIYTENAQENLASDVRYFQFQLSTNANFSPLYWNITCSNNFYNLLPPITNADGSSWAGTNYWQIVYMNSNMTVISTSAVFNFTLTPNPTMWDRSMLANSNYLLSIVTNHPHIWFNASNLNSMSAFLKTNIWPTYGQSWSAVTNTAAYYQSQSWWDNSSVTNLSNSAILAAVQAAQYTAFCYYMSGSNSTWDINGACATLNWFATGVLQKGMDQEDPYMFDTGAENTFGTAYDWLYPFMTSNQRSNVLFCLQSIVQFCAYDDDWGYLMNPTTITNWQYTNALTTVYYSGMKIGSSHERYCSAVGLEDCIAAMGESPTMLSLFPMFMCYSMGQFDPYQGDEGRGYAEQDNFKYDRLFGAAALSTVQFPAAKLWVNPIFTNLGTFFANWEPVGFKAVLEPWGDLGYGFQSQWFNTRYFDLALITGNGAILEQYNRASAFKTTSPDSFPLLGEAFLPYYYTTPAQSDWQDTSYFDIVRGWAISSEYPANNWGAFTNGVGFTFLARPGGCRIEHASFTDGQVELWAYGASCTAGGASMGYAKHPMYYNSLMVNGIGTMNPVDPPCDPWYSSIIAFTNSPNFTYVAGDITKGYNRSNYNTGGLGNMTLPFYTYSTNQVPYVSSIQRHVLFPHKKYLVIYDRMQTTIPATFQWLWHIMQPTAVVNTNGLGFTYTCTNWYNNSNVTVYVQHIVSPSLMAFTNIVGTNLSKFDPFTGENYFGKDNDLGPYYNSTVWAYNKTQTNNWHFLSVVYPAQWGQPAPTITRIDDYTVQVQQGTNDDVISFDETNASPASTIIVDLPAVTNSYNGSGGGGNGGGGNGGGGSPSSGSGPFLLVAHASAFANGSSAATTQPIDATGANLIVINASFVSGTPVISDSSGNTYTPLNSYGYSGRSFSNQLFYVTNPITSPNQTFSLSLAGGSGYPALEVEAFNLTNGLTPVLDTQNGVGSTGNNTSAIQATANITPGTNDELIVAGGLFFRAGGAYAVTNVNDSLGDSFTITDQNATGDESSGMAYLQQATAATVDPTWDFTGNINVYGFNAAAFSPAGPVAHHSLLAPPSDLRASP